MRRGKADPLTDPFIVRSGEGRDVGSVRLDDGVTGVPLLLTTLLRPSNSRSFGSAFGVKRAGREEEAGGETPESVNPKSSEMDPLIRGQKAWPATHKRDPGTRSTGTTINTDQSEETLTTLQLTLVPFGSRDTGAQEEEAGKRERGTEVQLVYDDSRECRP